MLKPKSSQQVFFKNISKVLKKSNPPSWIKFDLDKLKGEIIGEPSLEETMPPVDILSIFEYYSR